MLYSTKAALQAVPSVSAGTLPPSLASLARRPLTLPGFRGHVSQSFSIPTYAFNERRFPICQPGLARCFDNPAAIQQRGLLLGQMLVGEPTPTPTLVPAIVPPTWTPSPVGQLSPGQIATLTVIAGDLLPYAHAYTD